MDPITGNISEPETVRTAEQIAADLRARATVLEEQAKELRSIANALQGRKTPGRKPKPKPKTRRKSVRLVEPEGPDPAPFGLKADGTPYKRKPRSAEASAKAVTTRRRRAAAAVKQPRREMRLRVLSSTRPTKRELADREVVHVTEQPGPRENVAGGGSL